MCLQYYFNIFPAFKGIFDLLCYVLFVKQEVRERDGETPAGPRPPPESRRGRRSVAIQENLIREIQNN